MFVSKKDIIICYLWYFLFKKTIVSIAPNKSMISNPGVEVPSVFVVVPDSVMVSSFVIDPP